MTMSEICEAMRKFREELSKKIADDADFTDRDRETWLVSPGVENCSWEHNHQRLELALDSNRNWLLTKKVLRIINGDVVSEVIVELKKMR
jgi:hypothetical protein